ncbi:MAG: 50S ribosomal protein L28 [Candidatus Aquicultor secundus]|uniref:Large ribosomal subunit protein bL28 n=1 Tax=Candidatus Aquicultor secundus TaxID=1973895 RepID=A0A2M7T750_9ACTN|nr:50S ribosomal protein L28 [Candidatus Aquicultor secundus]NCO66789.1 50S ribosomal protein L28 [Solirubrobacter sp.]OIO86176.1 MAG: 50S ribosomal protein L28 [Candidatus Aquicultor secundus]PIU27565.1 MAG: 50S ribosomal protein L28 [Candidatus Aquicultor secundus]PIW22508.1 MAG: 50S ribosomal protein L28 [Candidatus Aquicultor secundus]PIX51278.1 MAG: 50S ribosomal protein L28 [Candidatus Aquicultor secundus]
MARKCVVCGKGPMAGNLVSHSHRLTRRRFNANVQKVRAIIDGSPKNVYVCAKCLKANKVTRVV